MPQPGRQPATLPESAFATAASNAPRQAPQPAEPRPPPTTTNQRRSQPPSDDWMQHTDLFNGPPSQDFGPPPSQPTTNNPRQQRYQSPPPRSLSFGTSSANWNPFASPEQRRTDGGSSNFAMVPGFPASAKAAMPHLGANQGLWQEPTGRSGFREPSVAKDGKPATESGSEGTTSPESTGGRGTEDEVLASLGFGGPRLGRTPA